MSAAACCALLSSLAGALQLLLRVKRAGACLQMQCCSVLSCHDPSIRVPPRSSRCRLLWLSPAGCCALSTLAGALCYAEVAHTAETRVVCFLDVTHQ